MTLSTQILQLSTEFVEKFKQNLEKTQDVNSRITYLQVKSCMMLFNQYVKQKEAKRKRESL